MSRITEKLSEQRVKEIKKRIDQNRIQIISELDFDKTLVGNRNKLVLFEKELIEYYRFFPSRDIGYTRAILSIALKEDCIIICTNRQHADENKHILLRIAATDIKPTIFQRILIKLGF